jgi:dynein heavy chain
VHARDVIDEFCQKKIQEAGAYEWTKQLKFYLDLKHPKDDKKSCIARICDWDTWYNYEYVGNTGRLVITPLTDRCYITLT